MKLEKFIVKKVLSCFPEDDLRVPARAMWDADCGSLPVVDSWSHVIGMITDRDICMAAYTQGRRLQDIRVQDVMSRSVVCCRANDSLEQAEELMRRSQVRRLPVVDAERRLVGLLSLNDIARAARTGSESERDAGLREVGRLLADISEPRVRPEQSCALERVTAKLSAAAQEIC